MILFENFRQEDFDKLKVFLISKFNIVFLNHPDSNVREVFEITTSKGNLSGKFYDNNTLEISFSSNTLPTYESISSFIKNLNDQITNSNEPDSPYLKTHDFAADSKLFFEHLSQCDSCKKKFLEIWNHSNL